MARIEELETLLARRRVVNVHRHPRLARVASALTAAGRLRRVHPGVYVAADAPPDLALRVLAARSWLPDGVFFGRLAARVTVWPGLEVEEISLAHHICHPPQPGLALSRRHVPTRLVEVDRGLRRTSVALTVADLIAELGSEILVRAFRAGVTLAAVEDALDAASRPGHRARRAILHEHRGVPWSVAEQRLHVILRECGITGWQSNLRLGIGEDDTKIIDVVLPRLRIAIEVDGFAYHHDGLRETFERDRYAASSLVARGWRVLRFTARQLVEEPDWVIAVIRATIALATGATK